MAMNIRCCAVLLLCALAQTASALNGSVAGRVTSRGDGERLVGATVFLQGTSHGSTTNARGEYRLADVPPGTYALVVSMVGYQRETRPGTVVEDGKETAVNVSLMQTPVQTEQIVVTASKRPQSLAEVPISMSVMEAREIEQRNPYTLDDALRYIPGVNITGGQLNIRGSSGYSRGAGSRVLMLLDGIPFITGDTGELNFESIPVGMIDRIEVVKGASSALYGSSALGGVVNIITKPIPEVAQTDLKTFGGVYNQPSYPQWRWYTKDRYFNGESFSHMLKVGDLGVALYFSRFLDDGYRQNDYRRRYNVLLKTREDFANASSLTLTYSMLYQYGGQYVYWRNLDSALVPPVLQQTDNVKSIRYFISGLYNGVLADNWIFTGKVIWYHNDWGYETIHAIGRTESVSDDIDMEGQSTLTLDEHHTLTFGAEGRFDMIAADLFGDHQVAGFALYGQDDFKLTDDLTFTFGTRYDYASRGLTTAGSQLSPKVALAYHPVLGTSLRASFGMGFRVPSIAEAFTSAQVSGLQAVPNNDLKPEKSFSYEVGISQALGEWGKFDIAGFRSDFKDLVEVGLSETGDIPIVQWRNVTRARVQGFETTYNMSLFDGGLSYSLGYTYVYPQDLTQHDLLKYRPRHVFTTSAVLRAGLLRLGADFRYVSRMDRIDVELINLGIIPDGDERTDIVVADFRGGADFTQLGVPLTASLNVNNAFQRNYVELIGNLMPPRTYTLVLEMHL
jgi:iron complex outermembrane receptor protein